MSTMQSVILRNGKIQLEKTDRPIPGPGQVLVKSLACGICGSDLHLTRHTEDVLSLYKSLGVMDPDQSNDVDIMLGHEFSGEVVEYGPETSGKLPIGTRITSVPFLMTNNGVGIGVTPGVSGAYSEYFLVDEDLMLELPEGVSAEAAATTEPLAVGLHSVNRSAITPSDVALVAGCGPIGLATIAALQMRGIEHIIASDPQDASRQLALEFGATQTVNPKEDDEIKLASSLLEGGRLVIFECVGIHQLLRNFIERAPQKACLVITGVHTSETQVNFAFATVKELDIIFSYYYSPEEFAECLKAIADGKFNWRAMLTGKVGIDGVGQAFETLMQPNSHVKVIIEPWRTGGLEATPKRE
ncbi:alcohol dehydrogenase [Microbulbifer flavimaris]|uniref:Alcohol dehydrogenase n=1 Tax=Microbulbifer flavimaris TaxID=1781068 RepID=A0ABX4I2N9_9GAMM|nr:MULTISPECIES: zinc-binding dehydrogenase [Microbulbifer]KUJ84598.1 alcohol dehydrogenase [Microbulbifer sp. ZGT114]PCO06684.1 alcohol dehydrogenase [Microbulbifer flavimaris]